MARQNTHYNQKGQAMLINGVSLEDYGDGDSIRFVRGGEIGSFTKGLDGAVPNIANDVTCSFEVDLKPTSPSNDFLGGLLKQQQANPPVYLDLTGQIIDGVNAIHSASNGIIVSAADLSTGGPEMASRTWVIGFAALDQDN